MSHLEGPVCRFLAVSRGDVPRGRKDLKRSASECTAHVRDAKESTQVFHYPSMNVSDILSFYG